MGEGGDKTRLATDADQKLASGPLRRGRSGECRIDRDTKSSLEQVHHKKSGVQCDDLPVRCLSLHGTPPWLPISPSPE